MGLCLKQMLQERRKVILCLLLTLTLTTNVYAEAEEDDDMDGKKYGESCDETEYCTGELVICQIESRICSCINPEDMIYQGSENRCLVQAGKACDIRGEMWKQMDNNCVQGAVCEEGFCVCTEGYYSSPNGTCSRKKQFKETCNSDQECTDQVYGSRGLLCVDGVCNCGQRGQIFEPERGCLGLVDSDCDENNSVYVNECTANAECVKGKGKCQCLNGYAKSTQGKCELGHGQPCGGSNLCADIYFICIEGRCQCKHPLHQIYDVKSGECLSVVSGPCTFPKNTFTDINLTGFYDIQKCTKNAHCVDRGFYSECECKPGFVQTKTGACAPGYGLPCESEECDPITPLFCRNNLCDCLDMLQVYDFSIKRCVGLVGSRCTTSDPVCVEFASCVLTDIDDLESGKKSGKCLCDRYAKEVSNRTCDYRV